MPRKRKAARAYRTEKKQPTREQIIRQLVDDLPYPSVASPLLAHIPEDARNGLVEEALKLFYEERHQRRLPMLRERLQNMSVSAWGAILCEAPELEAEMTDEQRIEWESWCDEARRRKLRETQANVLPMKGEF